MIDNNEIIQLLKNSSSSNIICILFEFRASCLVDYIINMANTVENYGYILIGVTSSPTEYNIIGLSGGIKLNDVINIALKN